METQISNRVLMVKPATFYYNAETAENNSFQVSPSKCCDKTDIHNQAIQEFDNVVTLLRSEGVAVEVIDEQPEPFSSDSVFPNNWISFHSENVSAPLTIRDEIIGTNTATATKQTVVNRTVVLYPMWSGNRRIERVKLSRQVFDILPEATTVLDLSSLENQSRFLEGTGSLVLDRSNRIAYACLSPRTSENAVDLFCKRMGYKPMVFHSVDYQRAPCYHTNVMMSLADKYCVICLDSIEDLSERVEIEVSIKNSGKLVIPLSLEQMNNFAGNCLQLSGSQGTFLVMSSRAYESLTEDQVAMITEFDRILHVNVETIENFGGGSVRCMIAEFGQLNVPACDN